MPQGITILLGNHPEECKEEKKKNPLEIALEERQMELQEKMLERLEAINKGIKEIPKIAHAGGVT